VAAARFSDQLDGSNPRTWVYLGALAVLFALQIAAVAAHVRREGKASRNGVRAV